MTGAERHDRVSSIFLEACDLPEAERGAYLDEACGDDDELRREVNGLLRHDTVDEGADGVARAIERAAVDVADEGLPERIGDYTILGWLGEGGMGVVYRARQHSPERDVALKVLRTGDHSKEMVRRFEREATLLGRLTHPNIARIYHAGMDDQQHPFLAMELVDGEPITSFVEQHRLSIRDRLQLLRTVAEAVQHAHQNDVIHRDLKPPNILVNADGEPRILDFGVARATQSDEVVTLQTRAGQVVGTIPYMSPEQVAGEPDRVGPRSDVYSLGVIAYELLSGRLPLDVRRLPLAEAARWIRDEEPVPLGRLDPSLRGDVETIVGAAIEKDPERRYRSAAAFADDIGRSLSHQPIEARPPSVSEQLSKFARRHRAGVAASVVVLLILVLATVVSVAFAIESKRAERTVERQRDELADTNQELESAQQMAVREVERATAVNEFLTTILDAADPFSQGKFTGADATLAQVLDAAAERIGTAFPDRPDVEGMVRITIATSYKGIARYDAAIEQFERALELLGPDQDARKVQVQRKLAVLLGYQKRFPEGIERLRSLLEAQRDVEPNELEIALTLSDLAWALKGNGEREEAELHAIEADRIFRSLLTPYHELIAGNASNLAGLLSARGEYAQARELLRYVLESYRRNYGEDHPTVGVVLGLVAWLSQSEGELETATEEYRTALDHLTRTLGEQHPRLADMWNNYGMVLGDRKLLDESTQALCTSLEIYAATLGDDHPEYFGTLNNLAFVLRDLERFEEADDAFGRYQEHLRQRFGDDYWRLHLTRVFRAECQKGLGNVEEAEAELLDTIEKLREISGPDSPNTRRAERALAELREG